MCGRFTITIDKIDFILKKFTAELAPGYEGYKPRYNAAPSQFVPTIVTKENERYLMNMFWGFVTPWGEKDDDMKFQANIRDDTIGKNTFFRNRLEQNRCIFIVDGFYEWKKPEGYEDLKRGERLPKGVRKTPYRIHMIDKKPFPLAGLWRTIKGKDDKTIVTAGIITTSPNALMESIHDRMPVILSDADITTWLDPSVKEFETLYTLLDPFPQKDMTAYAVSDAVNNSRYDLPMCIEPAA
jgi:putative SOS response-associated peptidase YedK